jgi:hypothetical protein
VAYPIPPNFPQKLHECSASHSFLSLRIFKKNSEAVEKGFLANPCDFRILKNQQVTRDGKSKNDRIWGFSTASADLCTLKKRRVPQVNARDRFEKLIIAH